MLNQGDGFMFQDYAVKLQRGEVAEAADTAETTVDGMDEMKPADRSIILSKVRRKLIGEIAAGWFVEQTGLQFVKTDAGFTCQRKKVAKSASGDVHVAVLCSDNVTREQVFHLAKVIESVDCPDVFIAAVMLTPVYVVLEGYLTKGDFKEAGKYPNGVLAVLKSKLRPMGDLLVHLRANTPWSKPKPPEAAKAPQKAKPKPPEADKEPEQEEIDPADVPFAL